MLIVVGIGRYAISNRMEDKLKTYALASCVAVTAYSKAAKVGGMVHVVLPSPSENTVELRPEYYATTGVPILIGKLCSDFGCIKSELQVRIYGGADSINDNDVFFIGKRNVNAVKEILSKLGLVIDEECIGGTCSRTIELDICTGEISVEVQDIII